ncbi:MAG: RDD family protein [Opitutae bacterium]|nr:RDD family protein [Opitutae bacterium]
MKSKSIRKIFALSLVTALTCWPVLRATETASEATPLAPSAEPPAAAISVAPDTAPENEATEQLAKPKKHGAKGKHKISAAAKSDHKSATTTNDALVSVFGSASTLAAGEIAEAVVSIFGSSTSAGQVGDAVVSVFGSSTSSGEVGDAVVSVFGHTRVTGGTVGGDAVAILGNNYVNGHVQGDVVAILGDVDLGSAAIVDGDITCIGGVVTRDAHAVVNGKVGNLTIGSQAAGFAGLHAWLTQCLLYARPLAFGPNLLWAWWLALGALGFYAVVAWAAPSAVEQCVRTLEDRPGKSLLAGVLTWLLTPVAFVLIALTVLIAIGLALLPLFALGVFIASLFGRVVMLAWLGRQLKKLFQRSSLDRPVIAVLLGGVVVLGLYTVPVIGFILYQLIGLVGFGVVVYTILLAYQQNKKTAALGLPPVDEPNAGAVPLVASLPLIISAATLPRAGFWPRLLATLLDAVVVSLTLGLLHRVWPGLGGVFPFWLAIYCISLWATKGATIGGIICGLKVVRLDDRPVTWSVAGVRGLSAFLSLAIAGLGFIWVAFDDDKQSWHDKIAGTTIVKVPKGTPLI